MTFYGLNIHSQGLKNTDALLTHVRQVQPAWTLAILAQMIYNQVTNKQTGLGVSAPKPVLTSRKVGSEMAGKYYTLEKAIKSFWKQVAITADSNQCWLWLGAKSSNGYGNKVWERHHEKAHRVAWMIPDYIIPNGMHILHSCDNPLCCNPKHLSIGTPQDNIDDMYSKGREARGEKVSNPGESSPSHKLTNEQVIEIRHRFSTVKVSKSSLAREFGISVSMIGRIIQRKNWTCI